MFFDAQIPDTSSYMVAGYVIFFLVTAIYLVSLIIRTRNLDRDLETLRGLEERPQARTAPVAAAPRAKAQRAKAATKTGKAAPAKPARKKTARRK